jgi:hypothetical protein
VFKNSSRLLLAYVDKSQQLSSQKISRRNNIFPKLRIARKAIRNIGSLLPNRPLKIGIEFSAEFKTVI